MDQPTGAVSRPTVTDWVFRVLGFLALVGLGFNVPEIPTTGLDPAWRMVLGRMFVEGRQFGTEVVFTYGPLGFIMGNTYWGGQWYSLLAGQWLIAGTFALVLVWHARQLAGYRRIFFLGFFAIFGLTYQDAAHQIIIVMAGLALLRRAKDAWRWTSLAWVLLLAGLSLIKFTNLTLAAGLVVLGGAAGCRRGWTPRALLVPAAYLGFFLLGWVACGQQLGNLPAYLRSSWAISQGYQDAMGFSCPPAQLYFGLVTLGLVVTYAALVWLTSADRIRGAALVLGLGIFVYLNWKHGFIRPDGHQIGFYFAALTVAVAGSLLLGESGRWQPAKRAVQIAIGLVSLVALEHPLPGVARGALGGAQARLDSAVAFALGRSHTRGLYDLQLQSLREKTALVHTKAIVNDASIDVLGFEQGVALFNGFNYQPRPVFQGYSAYTPYLSRLNRDYLASPEAPRYLLLKLQTLDSRLETMDDPEVLQLLMQRYTYLLTENGFTLWQLSDAPYDPFAQGPQPIRQATLQLGETLDLSDLKEEHLWVRVDYRLNWLGHLRRFFFRPPAAALRVTDNEGNVADYNLPRPIGRTGFIINPLVNNLLDYMRMAAKRPEHHAKTIALVVAPQDRDCFLDEARVELFRLPPRESAAAYFKVPENSFFTMFINAPVAYQALNPPNGDLIDGQPVMVLHAPSEMTFEVPAGAKELRGAFGFLPGAYLDGGNTNGAQFQIYSQDQDEPVILLDRFMTPKTTMSDRGLQPFKVQIPEGTRRLYLRVTSGPYSDFAYDWTAWTAIEFQ